MNQNMRQVILYKDEDGVWKVVRGGLTVPHRYDLFQDLKKTFRNSLRSVALAHVATTA
jgi:hypothetical protein